MNKHIENREVWKQKCSDVLRANLPDQKILNKLRFRYTCPAKEDAKYLPQWLWDSCFHSIVHRWLDPAMAWEELQSLLVHQVIEGEDVGMVPHMAYFAPNDDFENMNLFRHPNQSMLTQPPLISIAALAVHEVAPNEDLLRTIYVKSAAYHDWLDRRRDIDDDGLAAILHPWESGWDATQRWHLVMGITDSSLEQLSTLAEKRLKLVRNIFAHHGDAGTLASSGSFYVEAADFNAIRVADLKALAEIAKILGKRGEAEGWQNRAERVKQAIQANMIRQDGDRLRVYDLVGQHETKDSPDSAAKFILLFGDCVTQEQAELLLVDLHDSTKFGTPYQVPTTPIDQRWWNGGEYWQGNVWLPVNWLIYKGLRRYGYYGHAQQLARNSLDLVEHHGFCEFFNPITGKGGKRLGKACPQNQSWSTIVLDMLQTEISGL